jgi:hypothetical protein
MHAEQNLNHRMNSIDGNFCSQMRANGSIVSVLYVPYEIQAGYEGYVVPYPNKVRPALAACASLGYFYNAN